MTTLLNNYVINEDTMALLPAAHIDYDTIAIETNQELCIRKTPHQLIRDACLNDCSTYEGRREAVMHHFGFKRKVPVPISPAQNCFVFPTHAPADFVCSWIFYSHVQNVLPASGSTKNTHGQSIIVFKNGRQLQVDVSLYVLEKQLARTGMCMWKFGGW
ncbi:competence protein ComK [Lentibacillus persicus]|uniref:Competence protein ComK n=1 Tax=Lentibacillus persicus TaxID=640948 RepID=A0A1I1VWL5_9BACI|nr:competence protein ComK [Lentibacillus persicus]SFD87382.1 competence protein ComK [Lentibacillus persicus]